MSEKKYILLSHVLDENTPTYGNRDKFVAGEKSQIKQGAGANSSTWNFSINHIGSHIDMPKHFFDNGKTLTDYNPGQWIFENVQLIDIPCTSARLIMPADFTEKPGDKTQLLLIRTNYETYRGSDKYWNDNPGLAPQLGIWLRENFPDIRAVGFDFISLTSWKFRAEGREAHRVFLDPEGSGSPLWILEDLSLERADENMTRVIVSPLFVKDGDGSPVTVFAEIPA